MGAEGLAPQSGQSQDPSHLSFVVRRPWPTLAKGNPANVRRAAEELMRRATATPAEMNAKGQYPDPLRPDHGGSMLKRLVAQT